MVAKVYVVHRGRIPHVTPRLWQVNQVVFIPSAPLLLPSLNPDPLPSHVALREAVLRACAPLAEASRVIVVGSPGAGQHPDGSAAESGAHLYEAELPGCEPQFTGAAKADDGPFLPLALTIGRWALQAAGRSPDAPLDMVLATGTPGEIRGSLAEPAVRDLRIAAGTALLVVGDGTATRAEKSPGHIVDGAVALDDRIATMLGEGDLGALMRLTPELDATYGLDGRCAWQAAVAMVAASGAAVEGSELIAYSDPHLVAYFVAKWDVALPQ